MPAFEQNDLSEGYTALKSGESDKELNSFYRERLNSLSFRVQNSKFEMDYIRGTGEIVSASVIELPHIQQSLIRNKGCISNKASNILIGKWWKSFLATMH